MRACKLHRDSESDDFSGRIEAASQHCPRQQRRRGAECSTFLKTRVYTDLLSLIFPVSLARPPGQRGFACNLHSFKDPGVVG